MPAPSILLHTLIKFQQKKARKRKEKQQCSDLNLQLPFLKKKPGQMRSLNVTSLGFVTELQSHAEAN